nr:MAG TPA: helix-turn-helix domain protein [Caudoviricetes sp.]DAX70752.1 MAG TPA: helix-turn-helix domain protein [Caudoviricetes sp.]DAY24187.1 MAG TPA: helix-turn-helix domain protein [Caudoviricetes sp.]
MHISKQTIVNWEKGVTYPKPAYFEMLCRIYNIDRENIFLPSA